MFTFVCMLALRATLWPRTAAGRRPAVRAVVSCIVLVGTVIILIGPDVHSRANGRAMSQRADADQGEAYGEMALGGLRRRSQPITVSCCCTSIMPATDADIPRARTVQSRHGHAEHCCCSLRLAVLPVTGEDAQMRVGAERAERRLSEERVEWLCSAAYRLGIGRSQGQSSARIWTAAGTSACVIRVSLPVLNDAPGTQARVGTPGLIGGRTQ